MPVPSLESPGEARRAPVLTPRQARVLRAVVSGYVGEASPVGSELIAALLPGSLSSASVRNTLAELAELGLVAKPHRSAGRMPTELGFRVYLDQLLDPPALGDWERRSLADSVGGTPAGALAQVASRLLSERTRQLGFFEVPRLERVVLRHVSFVRVSTERVLAVLVSASGTAHQRLFEEEGQGDQGALDRMAATLNERLAGRTLRQLQEDLLAEAEALRSQAEWLLERALRAGAAPSPPVRDTEAGLVIATRLALLDQPEFHDPERIRELLEVVETKERLADVLDRVIQRGGVHVALGSEIGEPALRRCALVAAPYGGRGEPLGALGVIGPHRMDYARVIPLVEYVSRLVTEKFSS